MICRIRAKNAEQTILAQGLMGSEEVITIEGNWYFKRDQVDLAHLTLTDRPYSCPYKGRAYWYDLQLGDSVVKNVAWVYPQTMPGYEQTAERVGFYARETSATFPEEVPEAAGVDWPATPRTKEQGI